MIYSDSTGRPPTDLRPPPWTVRTATMLFSACGGISSLWEVGVVRWEERLEGFLEAFRDRLIEEVTTAEVEAFLAGRSCSGPPPSERLALQIMFRWVARAGGGVAPGTDPALCRVHAEQIRRRQIERRDVEAAAGFVKRLRRGGSVGIPEAAIAVASLYGWNREQTARLMMHLTCWEGAEFEQVEYRRKRRLRKRRFAHWSTARSIWARAGGWTRMEQMHRCGMEPTERLLRYVDGRRRKLPKVLHHAQAQAGLDARDAEIGSLLRGQMKATGVSRQQLVGRLGYRNLTKGLRRLDALIAGQRVRGSLLSRLAELLGVSEEVNGLRHQGEHEAKELRAQAQEERGLLGRCIPDLVGHRDQIATTEELRLGLPCESAFVDVTYIGVRYLPLETLLPRWAAESQRPVEGRFYVVGAGGSSDNGRGAMWGFKGGESELTIRRFDRDLAMELLAHPLVGPFQKRLREGQVLRIAEIAEQIQ